MGENVYQEFNNKVVLITGGTTGIGEATALAFANYGANVMICGRSENKAEPILSTAQKNNLNIVYKQTDVSDSTQVENLISDLVSEYGRIDIAFNNAGIDGKNDVTHNTDVDIWDKTIAINLSGVFYCLKYEIEAMLQSDGGRIVNNASVSGHRGYRGNPSYIASKHGLIGLTKAAAMEYADKNIRINSISPGIIVTPMFPAEKLDDPKICDWVERIEPMKRAASAEEVANSVLWLCSDQSSYTTGHDLAVDGGILAI
jgi:NAD(P)-dependent dehydrogenase (short-subunit alcohol dehydrogenase family)